MVKHQLNCIRNALYAIKDVSDELAAHAGKEGEKENGKEEQGGERKGETDGDIQTDIKFE